MSLSGDQEKFSAAVHDRIFHEVHGSKVLEVLINAAGLHESLLHPATFDSVVFHLDASRTIPVRPPEFEQLVLVIPASFEFSWQLSVSGIFMVKYKQSASPLPRQVSPFQIEYSGILTPLKNELVFKGEQVKLL